MVVMTSLGSNFVFNTIKFFDFFLSTKEESRLLLRNDKIITIIIARIITIRTINSSKKVSDIIHLSYSNSRGLSIYKLFVLSSSNVIFHVEGGYTEDNKNYTLFPGQTFIHFMKIRMRNESELTNSFYGVNAFPFYSFELENIDGSATIHYQEFNYVEDPSVLYGSDLSPLVLILTLFGFSLLSIGVCLILSVVILLNDWRTKKKKD